jgi:Aminoacyl-tRNA editing domain
VIDVNSILMDGARTEYAESPVERTEVRVMSRVSEHLEGQGVPFEPIAHQQTYTSIAEARALGLDASEVLKTVAVQVAGGHALMVVPATRRLDLRLVQAAVGDRHARLATEAELQQPGLDPVPAMPSRSRRHPSLGAAASDCLVAASATASSTAAAANRIAR